MEPDPRVKVLEQVGVLAVAAKVKDKDRVKARDAAVVKAAAADRVARDVARAWAADKDKDKAVVKVKDKDKAVVKVKAAVNQRRRPRIRPKHGTSARPRP